MGHREDHGRQSHHQLVRLIKPGSPQWRWDRNGEDPATQPSRERDGLWHVVHDVTEVVRCRHARGDVAVVTGYVIASGTAAPSSSR